MAGGESAREKDVGGTRDGDVAAPFRIQCGLVTGRVACCGDQKRKKETCGGRVRVDVMR